MLNKITSEYSKIYTSTNPNDIKDLLSSMAKARRVSVDELLESAEDAGPGAPPYLIRVSALARRLEKLEAR